jgi:hypothetical protein
MCRLKIQQIALEGLVILAELDGEAGNGRSEFGLPEQRARGIQAFFHDAGSGDIDAFESDSGSQTRKLGPRHAPGNERAVQRKIHRSSRCCNGDGSVVSRLLNTRPLRPA